MRITLFKDGKTTPATTEQLPQLIAAQDSTFWLDIVECDDDEARLLRDVFHFHPLAIEDTRNHRQRPKIEEYEHYLFIIINSVSIIDSHTDEPRSAASTIYHDLDFREINLFIGQNYVVSIHNGDDRLIEEARRRVLSAASVNPITVSYLTYLLIDTVIDAYFPVMDMFEEEIGDLEDTILARPNQDSLTRLFELKHMLLHMWRVVWPQRDILSNLSQPHILTYADQNTAQYYLRDATDHLLWIADMINTYRDTLTTVIDLYMSSVSNRLNQVINRLTILTLVIGLLTVISGFYGMNFVSTWPPFESPFGVPFVLMFMGLGVGALIVILRWVNRPQ